MGTTSKKDTRSWSVRNCTWSTNAYKILVKISWYYSNGKEDGKFEAEAWRWVTEIDNSNRTFKYEDGKPAYEFNSLSWALDFCMMAGINGYNASVVIMPEWVSQCVLVNNQNSEQSKWIDRELLGKKEEKKEEEEEK